jgi:hypothetical protein
MKIGRPDVASNVVASIAGRSSSGTHVQTAKEFENVANA